MSPEGEAVLSTPGDFRLRWDVFLSFRGEDTRHTITKRLYKSLESHGVRVFLDDDGLDRGDEIAPSLLEAIDDSAASIVVLSSRYAESHWCLEELAKICDCRRLILPVFYGVDPSDVRHQRGPFEGYFKTHEGKFQKEKVFRWREAMKKVGGFAGLEVRNSSEEDKAIRRLVQRILRELSNTPVGVAEFTVGLDNRIEELKKLLDLKSNGVRVLGLFGMGGVGKTTLAKSLFNTLVAHFERRSFISSVREVSSKDGGLISLQNRIISDISTNSVIPINDLNVGISAIKRTVHENRVLIILDDVDDLNQLETLIGRREWFNEGSRIVITTRDRQILPKNFVNVFYEVKELDSSEALELFSFHSMRRKEPADKLLNLSKQIVSLTGRLPLALEVFGSLLFGKRRVEEWDDALEKLKQIRPGHLQDVLKISFDGLDEQEKCIFLDIACLFVQMGMKRDYVIDILKGCGLRGDIAITELTEKCLIKIRDDNTLWMHDQIRDMGRQIVINESLDDPGMRSRLWDRSEILAVLKNEKGTRCIQGMVLDFEKKSLKYKGEAISWKNLQWSFSFAFVLAYIKQSPKKYFQHQDEKDKEVVLHTKSFESMVNLKLLQINHLRLEGKFKSFPAELKWLQWHECPLNCMPSGFWPRELAVLDLSRSTNIQSLWGWKSHKVPENIMVMNLSDCYNLAAVPDLSGCRRLEKIDLENCISLSKIHESIGNLITLRHLNLTRCYNLIELPKDLSGLKNLENLFLSDCSKLKALPENMASFRSLRRLLADNTALAELPETIFRLTKLEHLSLDGCQYLRRLPNSIGLLSSLQELSLNRSGLEELPNSIGRLENLEKLSLMWCQSLTEIPDSVGNLISLTELLLNSSSIRELPSSLGSLSYLKDLSVGNCKFLRKLPESIEVLASMVELQLDGTAITTLPDQIGAMRILRKLDMRNCKNLKSLPKALGQLKALTTLNIYNGNITELPESIESLENLLILRLNKCRMLRKLPDSIGNLKSLYHLLMEETALTELPESFGKLSNLRTLKMAKKHDLMPTEVTSSQENLDSFVISSSFCNLTLLSDLDARGWRISGKIHDDFEKLSLLETLDLSRNKFHSLPSSLEGLSILKKLLLRNCSELISLPALPSSLIELNVENCSALESIHDLSNLRSLQEMNLTNCVKVVDIPGLECFKSLRRLYLNGCIACSSTISKRFSKVALRNLMNLSMPGTRLPKWFSGETVSFSKPRNRELTGVIVGVVLSINHNIPNELRDHLPGVVDIQVNVLKLGKPLYSSALNLRGVPKTNEEHIHLCRYPDFHPLLSFLRDGDTFSVNKRNPPVDKGLELRKCGVHLIFEEDDDYEGDEESVDRSLQSVSEKLAKFFHTDEGDSPIYETETEVERQRKLEMEGQQERKSAYISILTSISNFISFVSLFFLLLSWLYFKYVFVDIA